MGRWARWLRWSGAVFVVACVAAQFVPLLDVLGYEYSVFVGALVSTVGLGRATARAGALHADDGRNRWGLAACLARDLAALVAIAGLVSLANAVRVRNCEPGVGLAYLAVFGLGAVPLASATAVVLAHFGRWRTRVGLATLLLGSSVAATLATLALEPAIVAYDTYFGYFAGSIYDESLVGFGAHLAYRAWTALTAVLALALLEVRRRPRVRDAVVGFVASVGLVVLFAFRGPAGLDRTRDYVIGELGGLERTEHFDIYYEATAFDARRLALLVSDHEARYAELTEFWGVEPTGRLRSFVYGSRGSKGRLMGGRNTLVAKIWLGEMHITWDGLGDELLGHEMAHLFLRDDGYGPLRLASRDGLIPIMALVEGAATAAAWGANELDYHHWSAAIHRLELDESISELLGPAGFWSRYSRLAYTLTGSFCRWLVDTRGPERFRAAYRRGDFEGAYGRTLDDLVGEWRAFLDAIALSEQQLEVARYRFDRPSLFGRLCARSIATRFERGEELVARRDLDAATRCFESILADDPDNVAYRLRVAQAYVALDDVEAATRHAAQVADAAGAGLAMRLRAAELLADIDWREGRVEAAIDAYERLRAEAGTEGDLRRLQAKHMALSDGERHPLTAAAVRDYLASGSDAPAVSVVAELMYAWVAERTPLSAYLAVLRVAAAGTSAVVPTLAATLDEGQPGRTPLTDAQRRRLAEVVALHHAADGEAERACVAWQQVASVAVPGSELAATAGMWLGRCRRGTLPEPDPVGPGR